jgi:ATP-dependent DNA helicase RecQ
MNDATLRELARLRPSTRENLQLVYGIGARKIDDFGDPLLRAIIDYCERQNLPLDIAAAPVVAPKPAKEPAMNATRALAFSRFREGAAVEDVMHQTGRSRSTILDYLCDFVRREKPESIDAWLAKDVYARVAAAIAAHGSDRLKPLYVALDEKIPYDEIRLVVAHATRHG